MLSETYGDIINSTFLSLTGITYTFKYITEDEVETFREPEIEEHITNKQIPWVTNLNAKYTFDTFVVGNANRMAFLAAKAVATAPGTINNPLFIYGRSGIGKTHLMQAVGNYIVEHTDLKVLYAPAFQFKKEYGDTSAKNTAEAFNEFKNKYNNVDVLIIDDIQLLVGADKTQTEFFFTVDNMLRNNKQLIISSDKSPDDLKKIEERLRSRFMWGLPVDIYPPDFNLRCDIIRAKIKNKSIEEMMTEDAIEYIANSCVNDVRQIEGTINRLLAYTAMMVPEKVTLDFAIEALKDSVKTNIFVENSIASIQRTVAEYFNITVEDLKSKRRTNSVVIPRHIAMYLCREETDEKLETIGLEFGGRDHSTVSIAIDKLESDLQTNEKLSNMLKEIRMKLQ